MPRKTDRRRSKIRSKKRGRRDDRNEKGAQRQELMKRILGFMRENKNKAYTAKQVSSETGLWTQISTQKTKSLMDELASVGNLAIKEKGRYQFAGKSTTVVGKLQVTKSGVGFLIREEGEDIFLNPSNMGKGLDGDIVRVRLRQKVRRRGGEARTRQEGEVTEVVQRMHTTFVGEVEKGAADTYFLIPDNPRINQDFYILPKFRKGAEHGQKALVELINWENRSPEVKVLEVLGDAGENETEMHAILLQYGFNPKFPTQVEAEADRIPEAIPEEEYKNRRDFREITTFTIDPVDAKDFDDALSLRKLENGNLEVGVHIADVSYYVRPGSEIDKEGFERATSVYLVDRTVPMLPEKLSNRVCSLRPHEEKLTYSAVFEMNEQAEVKNYWIGRTVIYSDHRFTYGGAQEVLEEKAEGPFAWELHTLNDLAKKLRAKRFEKGSVEFHSNEVKFVLDENDKPIKVIKKVMKDANHLIEDFMLLANRTVARHIHNLQSSPPLPNVYRIHDAPDPEKLMNLQEFVQKFGYQTNLQVRGYQASEALNQLLRKVEGSPEQHVIETLAVRSMAKAVYSTDNIGHFGLGFEYYSHFTSPIRRYPDLMVHRLLTAYHSKQYHENPAVLEAQAKHSSDRERTAAEAERASIKYKQVEFLSDKLGEKFEGVVSGIIEGGLFVELVDNMCEGFVPMRNLEGDYFTYDEKTYSIVGQESGLRIMLGDPVEVEIAFTDLRRRTIEMIFVQKLEGAPSI